MRIIRLILTLLIILISVNTQDELLNTQDELFSLASETENSETPIRKNLQPVGCKKSGWCIYRFQCCSRACIIGSCLKVK